MKTRKKPPHYKIMLAMKCKLYHVHYTEECNPRFYEGETTAKRMMSVAAQTPKEAIDKLRKYAGKFFHPYDIKPQPSDIHSTVLI